MAKYESINGGLELVKVDDNGNSGESFSVSKKMYDFLKTVNRTEIFAPTKKAVKDAGLAAVDAEIEKCYYAIKGLVEVECTSFTKNERKNALANVASAIKGFYRATGTILTTNDGGRQWLYSVEFHTVRDCFSIKAASKTKVAKTENRLDCTSLVTFRKAVWNAFYVQANSSEKFSI